MQPLHLSSSQSDPAAGGVPLDAEVLAYSFSATISAPYALTVEFSTTQDIDLKPALGTTISLLITDEQSHQKEVLSGEVFEARMVRAVGQRLHFELVARPALAKLAYREDVRIFQDLTFSGILSELLGPSLMLDTELHLGAADIKLPFVVQYRESALNFLTRLCEDLGIFYFFEHREAGVKLIFAETFENLALPEPLAFSFDANAQAGAVPIQRLLRRERLRTSKVALRDYHVENPNLFPEAVAPLRDAPYPQPVYDYPGRFVEGSEGTLRAQSMLRALRHDAEVFEGQVETTGVSLGRCAAVSGASEPDLNTQIRFVAVSRRGFQHTVSGAEVHDSIVAFRAVLHDADYLPQRRARRPRIAGIQTAVVVGDTAKDQGIYVDDLGRVKVRFHFDRLSPANETASCYIRPAQLNLGGSMILPRVGWEVAVAFLEGDPDRPIVLGKLYNGENAPPMTLPGNKSFGSFSSRSSPGGGGKNSISLGDSGGSQGFSISAQKDLNIATLFDQTEDIQVDDESQVNLNLSRSVKVNDSAKIAGNQELTVGAHCMCTVGGDQSYSVSGNEIANATANLLEKIGGARAVTISGNQLMLSNGERIKVEGAVSRTVGAVEILCTAANLSQNVGGASSSKVGAARIHLTGGSHGEVVTGAKSVTIAAAAALVVKGSRMTACEGAVAHLVGAMVKRKIDGTYTLKAPMISLVGGKGKFKGGSSEMTLSGGPIKIKGGTITIKAAIIKKTAGSIKMG